MWFRIHISISAVLLAYRLLGQTAAVERYSPEAMREDLEAMRATLHAHHPDPYRYRDRGALDLSFDSVSAAFRVPLTEEEFIRALMPLVKIIGDGGTRLSPSERAVARYSTTEPLIPLQVAVLEDGLFSEAELKGFRSFEPGARILSINGRRAGTIVNDMRALLSADGKDTTFMDRTIERDFAMLHRRCYGPEKQFDVVAEQSGGTVEQRVFPLTGEEIARMYRPRTVELAPWRLERVSDGLVAWVTLSGFDKLALEGAGVHPGRFLGGLGDMLRKTSPEALVIDVRGADGADMDLVGQLYELFATEPFRLLHSMSVRTPMELATGSFVRPGVDVSASLAGGGQGTEGVRLLRGNDQRTAVRRASPKAYTGPVYVLADGRTRNAGALFAMVAKRSGRAILVGEELGSNALSFCGGEDHRSVLPRTGVRLQLPLVRYVPAGSHQGPADRSELPHHHVVQRPWYMANGQDALRTALILMLEEIR